MSSENDKVLQYVVWLCLSNVDGRGRAAAEKGKSLQSLICKHANERVIKIGLVSGSLIANEFQSARKGEGMMSQKIREKELDIIVLSSFSYNDE